MNAGSRTGAGARGRLALVAALLLGLVGAGTAAAQTRRVIVGETADPAEVARLFDAYTVMQAQETLGLSDEQFGPFVTRLKALQQTRRRNLRERAMPTLRIGDLVRDAAILVRAREEAARWLDETLADDPAVRALRDAWADRFGLVHVG